MCYYPGLKIEEICHCIEGYTCEMQVGVVYISAGVNNITAYYMTIVRGCTMSTTSHHLNLGTELRDSLMDKYIDVKLIVVLKP